MEFTPGRRIHQGDPISPFLFIIAVEDLNILAKRAITNDQFRGICVGHDKIIVSHLQYADDTIFFGEWSKRSTPFTYLGLPIGVPTTKASSWKPIIEKFDKRLSEWKAKSMS
ncbi:uncharacterized mitochondrial protein AtMg01250-like [Rutidosis leptorrhynchoides]|uniref:uncharacterized mitochondrial protein AtMg01250-like n=1 Tax=Rutidosis leptorrhynchoides TaxID=125765 RepID=UPI003A9928FD